ncbi:helix-turn-helix domain-containing protein [Hymenobacter properus]|uniref:AraC family transcriptional regulator n=1 Tax=Hymenobacter properus TaxID=2791026 RepID=A0A931FJE4_9BACT|nr:helix-turn-helix domain-containing protein [Hymenobacter properus]MBF9141793.1 AraC family transcriptional regulator [Hymenobacter properus]MBR7720601.1 AraC family transcriptional regulator [Microvirga sp. SRT04]
MSIPALTPAPATSQLPEIVATDCFNVYAREQFNARKLVFGRRDYYKISLLTGSSRYNYATRGVLIDRPALVFSNPLIPYSWEPVSAEQGGYLCMFTEEFLIVNDRAASLQESPLFRLGSDPVYLVDETQYADLSYFFRKMLQEMNSGYVYQQEVIRNYLNLLIHEALKLQPQASYYQHPNAATRIAALFQGLLERQFPIDSPTHGLKLRTPGDFARQLSVHVNHLNRAVRDLTGKTTSVHIAERIIREARALLQHTDWSTAEIAYSLGFEYPTYFNNFFKKQTGTTPSAHRALVGRHPVVV